MRKQLSLVSTIIGIIIANDTQSMASAWLPHTGHYKYHASIINVDQPSIKMKQKRAQLYSELQKKLYYLTQYQQNFSSISTRYLQIQRDIDSLNKQISMLSTYTDEKIYTSSIEYGISKNSSIGIKLLRKDDKFYTTRSTHAVGHSNSADIFYKVKLLEHNSYIFLIQPQIYAHKDSRAAQELFYETALITGTSYNKGKITFVLNSEIALCHGINSATHKKRYYSLAASESIKMPYGFMFTNFSKYYIRSNYGLTYHKTIYEQLAIAKTIHSNSTKRSDVTIQIGYFWNHSLNYIPYKISGTIFSIWTEI